LLFSGNNELVETRFEQGYISGSGPSQFANQGKVKMLMSDGSYYQGTYNDHERHGQGLQIYPNGDRYDGAWTEDKRFGRCKLIFARGGHFYGNFIADMADGSTGGQIEDQYKSIFRVMDAENENGENISGKLVNSRLQGKCAIDFYNGD
jgi:hypothetical protein